MTTHRPVTRIVPATRTVAVPARHAALLGDGDQVLIENGSPAPLELLLLAGAPLREPVVQYGPFVMNTRQEIFEAIRDYQSGAMGTI